MVPLRNKSEFPPVREIRQHICGWGGGGGGVCCKFQSLYLSYKSWLAEDLLKSG